MPNKSVSSTKCMPIFFITFLEAEFFGRVKATIFSKLCSSKPKRRNLTAISVAKTLSPIRTVNQINQFRFILEVAKTGAADQLSINL